MYTWGDVSGQSFWLSLSYGTLVCILLHVRVSHDAWSLKSGYNLVPVVCGLEFMWIVDGRSCGVVLQMDGF